MRAMQGRIARVLQLLKPFYSSLRAASSRRYGTVLSPGTLFRQACTELVEHVGDAVRDPLPDAFPASATLRSGAHKPGCKELSDHASRGPKAVRSLLD